jgi:multidrug efflux pump
MLPTLRASIPADIDLVEAVDLTTTIRTSLHDVERTLLISIAWSSWWSSSSCATARPR